MANISTTTLYLSFLLASSLLLQSLPATSADKNFVNQTCNNTPNPSFCMETLLSDPGSLNQSTVDGLAVVALNIAIRSADAAASHASDLSDKYAGEPEQDALDFCTQTYSDVSQNCRDAQEDLPRKGFEDAETLTSQSEDAVDDCEKEFASRNLTSLLSDTSKKVKDQSGLCGDIIDLLYDV